MAHELEFVAVSEAEIAEALRGLPGWERAANKIQKTYQLPSFLEAIAFVNRVAVVAEQFNHHPDIEILYKKVKIAYWTHKTGGISKADLVLAAEVERIGTR